MRTILLTAILVTGCTATANKDELCIDWGSYTTTKERCIPLYGNIICAEEEVTEYYCKLYEEIGEGENTLHSGSSREHSSS